MTSKHIRIGSQERLAPQGVFVPGLASTSLSGGNSEWEPPDPFPNSEVKLLSADDSVGSPHVKVGHCQAFK